ncbi:hypothetical protein BC940DRAFT_236344, partial [Gongronella butleri]
FENAFDTDGFATSFTFKRPKGDAPPYLTLDKAVKWQLRQCRAWGVDPGVNDIFVAVDGSSYASGIYSAAPHEYNRLAGIPRVNAWLENKKAARGITYIESRIPTARTARVDRVHHRVEFLLASLPTLLAFYDIEHQAKRFSLYRGKQRANAEMVNILVGGGKKYARIDQDAQRRESPCTGTTKYFFF